MQKLVDYILNTDRSVLEWTGFVIDCILLLTTVILILVVLFKQFKKKLINTLIKTIEHLSSRKIGAIITIEKEHNLNSFIDKAVKLDAIVSYELLNTIFFPNTALHDGAVIIRGNHIVCASAFLP